MGVEEPLRPPHHGGPKAPSEAAHGFGADASDAGVEALLQEPPAAPPRASHLDGAPGQASDRHADVAAPEGVRLATATGARPRGTGARGDGRCKPKVGKAPSL